MSPPAGSWVRTAAWYRAGAVAALAIGVGWAVGRADVVALAAPLVLGAVLTMGAVRPMLGSRTPRAGIEVGEATFGSNNAEVTTHLVGTDGVEFVSVAQPGRDGGTTEAMVTVPGGPPSQSIRARFVTSQWGVTAVARPDLLGAGPDGVYLSGPVRRGPLRTELVLPEVVGIAPLGLPPIMGGWAGAHISRRPGQGSDLVDLREFAPGDRLRSIHWRAFARHGRLYTRRTRSDAEAELMICLDLSTIVQPRLPAAPLGYAGAVLATARATAQRYADAWAARGGDDRRGRRLAEQRRLRSSSLDVTVTAVAAVAAAHLGQGDRVGMMAAAVPRRVVRPGTGNRQLQRIRHQLALLEDRRYRLLDVALWGLRPGQIVLLCSPMVGRGPLGAARDCRSRGHRVIVVDTLPLSGLLRSATRRDADHLRVLTVERELHLDRLRGNGIPVLSWDAGDLSLQMSMALRAMRGRQ